MAYREHIICNLDIFGVCVAPHQTIMSRIEEYKIKVHLISIHISYRRRYTVSVCFGLLRLLDTNLDYQVKVISVRGLWLSLCISYTVLNLYGTTIKIVLTLRNGYYNLLLSCLWKYELNLKWTAHKIMIDFQFRIRLIFKISFITNNLVHLILFLWYGSYDIVHYNLYRITGTTHSL